MKFQDSVAAISRGQDIKYSGPLSFRGIRIIGWVAMWITQLSVVFNTASQLLTKTVSAEAILNFTWASLILKILGQVSVPMFLVANFALILSSKENIKKLILTQVLTCLAITGVVDIIYYHYIWGLSFRYLGGAEGIQIVDEAFREFFTGFLSFNVFTDLVLCTLSYFFLAYRPKKLFRGKKIIWFRLLVILPIAYEIAAIAYKAVANVYGMHFLPIALLPLLPSKPFITFLIFLAISIHEVVKERKIKKYNLTQEQMDAYYNSNRNSFDFAHFTARSLLLGSLIDFCVAAIIAVIYQNTNPNGVVYTSDFDAFFDGLDYAEQWGAGAGSFLFAGAPFVLLLNFKKGQDKKNPMINYLILIPGLAITILILIEGYYQVLIHR